MAELRVFADQAKEGGGKLHLGATSMDIEDNADVMIFGKALDLVTGRLVSCLDAAAARVRQHKGLVCMGWTHLQPAEPTTMGYRFANYAQDIVLDIKLIETLRKEFLKGKGVKGAVGTSASYTKLLGSTAKVKRLEEDVMSGLGLGYFDVATQTYPRKLDYLVLSALASVAASCAKFGLDIRVLQSPTFGELSEPIEESQVGSSAMPFKRNPVTAERMCSLARVVSVMPLVAFMNASNSILERTLDDSAARRIAIPEAFLAVDECLAIYERLMRGLAGLSRDDKEEPREVRRLRGHGGRDDGARREGRGQAGGARAHQGEVVRGLGLGDEGRAEPAGEAPLARTRSSLPSSRGSGSRLLLDPSTHTGDARESCDEFLKKVVSPILAGHKKASRTKVEY